MRKEVANMRSIKQLYTYFLWYLVITDVSVNTSRNCPSMCKCGMLISKIAINCENKDLLTFPRNMSRSTELMRFRENSIARIPQDFSVKWPNTTTLSIEKNKIKILQDGSFTNLKQLREVFLSGNAIRSIGRRLFAGSAPDAPITFSLENNLIETVSEDVFRDSTSNFVLNWNSNRIRNLSPAVFEGAEGIQYLNLEQNKLEKLKTGMFKDLSKLYFLGLGSNNISWVENGAFRGLHRVETLTLQKNRISKLAAAAFQDLAVVKDLNLEENLFSEIPIEVIRSLPKFVKVKLKRNPIICTCSLTTTLADSGILTKIADLGEIKCYNKKMTVKEALTFINCATSRPSAIQTTIESATNRSNGKISNVSYITHFAVKTDEQDETTLIPRLKTDINREEGYANQPPLPLIIGVTTGALIIIVVIVLFVYLYRRPIAARASTTLSLTRKRKNSKSTAYVYHYPKNDYTVDYNI